MSSSKIEWLKNADGKQGYTINPVKGLCPMACSYCYARRMYKRFKWDESIRFDEQSLFGLPDKPARIFVGSTMELFGQWVKPNWWDFIIQTVALYPYHTFIFLTKLALNLPKRFPDNCWVGASATNSDTFAGAVNYLMPVKAKIKFVSIEPLLNWPRLDITNWMRQIDWVIIGQQTPIQKNRTPKIEWINEIIHAADENGVPVFLKNNLRNVIPLINLRQEFPNV